MITGNEKISKKTPDSVAGNFDALKAEALNYIQTISGNTWTDYNTHDPGVTIAEQLTYAINELSYRTAFDIKDILAEDNGEKGKQEHFFSARKILTTNPVSIDDFRKAIIDVEGVKNGWLEPRIQHNFYTDGPKFYKDEETECLRYVEDSSDKLVEPVKLIGLYDLLLEFENHSELGDLNSNSVKAILEISSATSELNGLKLEMTAEYPYWDAPEIYSGHTNSIQDNLQNVEITLYRKLTKATLRITKERVDSRLALRIEVIDNVSRQRRPDLEQELQLTVAQTLNQLATTYQKKLVLIRSALRKVQERIHGHRNLCEDFIHISSLKVKEIALCMKIDLEHSAKPDVVQATIFHEINKFLSPAISFQTLDTLLNKNIAVDDIFDGPALNNGFVSNDQLGITDRRRIIYISDLINIVSDVQGVKFVKEIEVAKKENDEFQEHTDGTQWHLELSSDDGEEVFYVPRLNSSRSNIRFYKDNIPLSTNAENVSKLLAALEALTGIATTSALDLKAPLGRAKNIGSYSTIQNDFPNTYGINEFGIAPSASDLRKAQAHQLKGYLLVFEQVITNYLAQLANINQLFSLNLSVDRTYFVNDLYDIPHIAHLLKDFIERYSFKINPKDDDPDEFAKKWAKFISDPKNEYLTKLEDMAEPGSPKENESVFLDRRNRFLNHLMARFSEHFSDYATIMHSIDRSLSGIQLIEDKALLLKDYPFISSNRGRGFNYLNRTDDQHQTLTGLEIRMARLLGIDVSNLTGSGTRVEKYKDKKGFYRFRMKDHKGEIILNSERGYMEEVELEYSIDLVLLSAITESNYQKKLSRKNRYFFNLTDSTGEIIARSQEYYLKEETCDEEILRVMEHIRKIDEKVRVVEHILLRPRIKDKDKLLPVYSATKISGEKPVCCPGTNDPYSFTISVVLPSWPTRFRNLDFRRHVEKKIRMETPAHIFARICWVNMVQMGEFETALTNWKEAITRIDFNEKQFLGGMHLDAIATTLMHLAFTLLSVKNIPETIEVTAARVGKLVKKLYKFSKEENIDANKLTSCIELITSLEKVEKILIRSDSLNRIIEVMSTLRNVYPEATLYDCQESEAGNPISLNQTILGTFKPLEEDE